MMAKKLFGDFYSVVFKDGEEVKTDYKWEEGEKEEYLKVCELAEGWGGIPFDVDWAKGTQVYKDALKKLISSPI